MNYLNYKYFFHVCFFIGHRPCLEEDDSSHIIVDLNKCTWEFAKEYVYSQVEVIETLHPTMKTKFFPLAEDDYFMAVAILSGMLNEKSDDSKVI